MWPVTVYTRAFCPYCTRALALLQRKGAAVTEVDGSCPQKRQEMIAPLRAMDLSANLCRRYPYWRMRRLARA